MNSRVTRCAVVMLILGAAGPVSAESPIDIPAGQRQLFLDNGVVADMQGLQRTLHSPRKLGAVIRSVPGETIQIRTAPVWDAVAQVYKLWLLSTTRPLWISADGLNWTPGPAPNLRTDHVVYDPNDPDPNRRFKGVQTNAYFAVSPDGITWTKLSVEKVPSSDESNLSYDPAEGLFIHTVKRRGTFGRSVAMAVSRDFEHWDDYGLVFQSDEEDQRRGAAIISERTADSTLMQPSYVDASVFNVDVYNMGVFHYEGQYIGLPAMFHSTGPVPNYPNTDGFHVIQLAVSRDLTHWQRVADRATFIGPSRLDSGAYDLTQILPPSEPVVHGDELWFYYTGLKYRSTFYYEGTYPDGRTIDKPGLEPDRGAVCLAVLRRDGFVSLDPAGGEGVLTTHPFRLPAARLMLNVEPGDGGSAQVELLGPADAVLATSEPVTTGGVSVPVEWQGDHDLKSTVGQVVQLRVRLDRCSLYSFVVDE